MITHLDHGYTHLLDGDLRVRDDFRFDNEARSENSKGFDRGRDFAANALAQTMTAALAQTPQGSEALKQMVAKLEGMIEGLAKKKVSLWRFCEFRRDS